VRANLLASNGIVCDHGDEVYVDWDGMGGGSGAIAELMESSAVRLSVSLPELLAASSPAIGALVP
jgi:hypothetical protein